MIRFWDFKLFGAPPLLSFMFGGAVGNPMAHRCDVELIWESIFESILTTKKGP
jgi:hypothetical protein